MESHISILEQFVKEKLDFKETHIILKDDLYKAYLRWCKRKGHEPMESLSFKKQFLILMKPFSDLGIHHIISDITRLGFFKRVHIYRGVRLK